MHISDLQAEVSKLEGQVAEAETRYKSLEEVLAESLGGTEHEMDALQQRIEEREV